MPETFREYPVMEVCLYVRNNKPNASGTERVQEGDIVAVRRPLGYIGNAERGRFLWLHIEGLDFNDFTPLSAPLEEGTVTFEKRRYSIPFDRLPSTINLARVRDPSDWYQPFLLFDEDDGFHIETAKLPPLSVYGLVFDKQTRKFL